MPCKGRLLRPCCWLRCNGEEPAILCSVDGGGSGGPASGLVTTRGHGPAGQAREWPSLRRLPQPGHAGLPDTQSSLCDLQVRGVQDPHLVRAHGDSHGCIEEANASGASAAASNAEHRAEGGQQQSTDGFSEGGQQQSADGFSEDGAQVQQQHRKRIPQYTYPSGSQPRARVPGRRRRRRRLPSGPSRRSDAVQHSSHGRRGSAMSSKCGRPMKRLPPGDRFVAGRRLTIRLETEGAEVVVVVAAATEV